MIPEPFAAKVGLRQRVPLNHRPHRAVEDQDPLREKRFELCPDISFHLFRPSERVAVFLARLVSPFTPEAINTVNGSPALRAPTPTLT